MKDPRQPELVHLTTTSESPQVSGKYFSEVTCEVPSVDFVASFFVVLTGGTSGSRSSSKSSNTRHVYASSPTPSARRQRRSANVNEPDSSTEDSAPIHVRACERCKSLKVKCEVKSLDGIVVEPCRRCKNAKHSCVLPGMKQRRAPP